MKSRFESVTDDAIVIHTNGAEQTFSRSSVQKAFSQRPGHRGRHALIGAAIGAGAGLGTGAAIDHDCSRQSIVCTGNKGKAILTPVFGLIGAGIGAALPAGGWQEIYRSHWPKQALRGQSGSIQLSFVNGTDNQRCYPRSAGRGHH